MPGRSGPPPGLSLNLSSNNPFRNRNLTPSPHSADPRLSRFPMAHNNPFLDAAEVDTATAASSSQAGANKVIIPDDIFNDLSLLDKPRSNANGAASPKLRPAATLPVNGQRPGPENGRDRSRAQPPRGSQSPVKYRPRRRASESSIMGKDRRPRDERPRERERDPKDRPPRTESEERRRRERRKEREERHRREKESGKKSGRRPQGLDIIDKLDVTGIYGQGLFHHDGPFDACNPHRNAKKDRRAPMRAFPADSANMALGGFGAAQPKLDLDRFHGRGEEGFNDYAYTKRSHMNVVDPTQRTELVHGEETYGLGTSTHLEGAPASRSALQRRDSDEAKEEGMGGGGLSRKKSLAQRFRGMSTGASARPRNRSGDYRSPEARYTIVGDKDQSPPAGGKALSAGGPVRARYTKENEVNPFFEKERENDYDSAFEKKGTQIRIAEDQARREKQGFAERPTTSGANGNARGHIRAVSSKGTNALVRSVTSDSVPQSGTRGSGSSSEAERVTNTGTSSGTGGGFLSRMKSLKGKRPQRVES